MKDLDGRGRGNARGRAAGRRWITWAAGGRLFARRQLDDTYGGRN